MRIARADTLQLTLGLYLDSSRLETLNDIPQDWLFSAYELLPALTSMRLPGSSLIDYGSIQRLCYHEDVGNLRTPSRFPVSSGYGIRLLDISNCGNPLPPRSLITLFERLPSLVYLDISGINGARNLQVLDCIFHSLTALENLKLRHVCLTDHDLERLVCGLGTRLWSLDVRDNRLTDISGDLLVDYCFPPPVYAATPELLGYGSEEINHLSPASTRIVRGGQRQCARIEVKDQVDSVSKRLKNKTLASRLDVQHGGLSHLYISGNTFTVNGVLGLLKTTHLQLLDCGRLQGQDGPNKTKGNEAEGATEIISTLESITTNKLSWLRIDHRLLTGLPIVQDRDEVLGRSVFPNAHEMAIMSKYLDTLVLTEVPMLSTAVAAALIWFLTTCALHGISTMPNEASSEDGGHYKMKAVRLRALQLEMTREAQPDKNSDGGAGSQKQSSLSITEDLDSDAFIRESTKDFSFFEKGSSSSRTRTDTVVSLDHTVGQQPSPNPTGSMSTTTSSIHPDCRRETSPHVVSQATDSEMDVISELVAFRTAGRAATGSHRVPSATAIGSSNGDIPYWSGDVKIVIPSTHEPNPK